MTLQPLAGQFLDGVKIPSSSHIVLPKDWSLRGHTLGTIFGVEELRKSPSSPSLYEAKGGICQMGVASTNGKHKAMLEEYAAFIGTSEDSPTVAPTVVEEGLLGKMVRNDRFAVPDYKDGYYVDRDQWYLLLRNINNCINTLLLGESGTGKTTLLTLACQRLGIPYSIYDMGAMHDPIPSLLGVHRLEGGGSVFDYARFTQDVQKPGVIILDELSRCSPMAVNILFPCLDHRRELPVELAGSSDKLRNIKIHPECCFVATANVGTEYSGTMSMDRALVGRFFPLELSFMPREVEVNILVKRCGISFLAATKLTGIAGTVRRNYEKEELSTTISTRETLMAGNLVADGWTPLKAMELVYLPLFEGTKDSGERSMVAKMLMGL